MVAMVPRALRAGLGRLVCRVLRVLRGHRVLRVPLGHRVQPVRLVRRGRLVRQARVLVMARWGF